MYNAADVGEGLVENNVCGCVGRRLPFAFYDFTVEVYDDHIFSLHDIVFDTGGLDYNETGFAVNA